MRHRPLRKLASRPLLRPKAATFADVMEKQGTVPLARATGRIPPPRSVRPKTQATSSPAFSVEREEDWLEGQRVELPASVRRRLRGTPTATLDLHRLDADTARRRLLGFLATERAHGRELVLVIVGRGRHSPGGQGVLRANIAEWLTSLPASEHVLAFRTATRELGGTGGVVVLLSPSSERAKK